MFQQMKLGTKIVAGFAVVTLIAAVMGLVGYYGLHEVAQNVYEVAEVRLPSVQTLLVMSESQNKILVGERGLINRRMMDPQVRKAQYDYIDKAWKHADEAWKIYEPLPQTKEEAGFWKEFVPKWEAWKKAHQQVVDASREKDSLLASGVDQKDKRIETIDSKAYTASLESRKKFLDVEVLLSKLVDLNEKLGRDAGKAGEKIAAHAKIMLGSALIIAILLSLLIGLYLKRNIAAILKGLLDESSRLAEAAVAGKLATRGNLEQVNFEFRGIVEGVNQTLDAVIGPLNVAAEYVDRISKGDIPPKINDSYNGDFNEVKNNLNVLIDAMNTVTSAAAQIALGNLSVEMRERSPQDQLMQALTRMVATLRELAKTAEQIADGNLTVQVKPASENDAIGNAFATMVKNLREIVGNVGASSDSIATATKQIATGNADMAQRTETQASSLEEIASSMEELTSTVKQNADNSQQANQLAIDASDVAVKGGTVITRVVSTMDSISDSSKKIADIISVIDGIAFQTNILALNAAVEAARAGEQGRGFAVVAGEVRNLAQRSAAAAKEIKELISDSVDKVGNGSKLVGEAGQTMQEIVSSIKRVTDIMAEISAASVEQSSGIEQVNVAINSLDDITQQNSSVVQEATSAAAALEDQAHLLVAAVARFTLDEQARTAQHDTARLQRLDPLEAQTQAAAKISKQVKQMEKTAASNGYHHKEQSLRQAPAAKAVGHDEDWSSF